MDVLLYLFVFLLVCISVTDLWSTSYIFSRPRNWISRLPYTKMLICAECFSFWVGFALSFVFNPLIAFPGLHHFYFSHIFSGSITYLASRILYGKGVL